MRVKADSRQDGEKEEKKPMSNLICEGAAGILHHAGTPRVKA
jgi:hypothetical protein